MKILRRTALTLGGAALLSSTVPGYTAQANGIKPRRDGRIQLANGRWIGYSEYGTPTGPLVFYFHGTPSSRLELSLCGDDCINSDARIIAVDRPGMGLSTYQAGRKILDWPDVIDQIATAFGYRDQSFGIIGMSGGAPYALACAYRMPHRLKHVVVVSGYAPMGAPGVCGGNQDKLIELVNRRPRLAKQVGRVLARRIDHRPDKMLQKVTAGWTEADRRLVLCNPKHRRQLIANIEEALRCGPNGVVADVRLLAHSWCFPLNAIQGVSVTIWQGGCDQIATPSMGRYFHEQIAGSELFIDPRGGHVTTLKNHTAEILSKVF